MNRNRFVLHSLRAVAFIICIFIPASGKGEESLAGVRGFIISTRVDQAYRQGPCAMDSAAIEERMALQLRASALQVVPFAQAWAVFGQHVREFDRDQQQVRRDGRSTDEARAASRRREERENAIMAMPSMGTMLVSKPVLTAGGEAACALTVSMRISVGTASRRAVIAATGRESRASIQLWMAGPTLQIVPVANWEQGLHDHVAAVVESFLASWRSQNIPGDAR